MHQSAGTGTHTQRTIIITGSILGVGLMGAIDTIVFHLLLQWHNFYVHTTDYWRLFSDGLLHTFTTVLLFYGAIRIWRSRALLAQVHDWKLLGAGLLWGMGGFQLYDGVVHHMILQIHPVREGATNLWIYDLTWNMAALVLLVGGFYLWNQVRLTRHSST